MKIKYKIFTAVFLFSVALFQACTGNNDRSKKSAGMMFVIDQAALLSKVEKNHMIQLSGALLRDMDIHIMTVVLKQSPENMDKVDVTLFFSSGPKLHERREG